MNSFLIPGLIDLHIHAPQFAYTGTATDRPLMGADGWLETYTFPAEAGLLQDPQLCQQVYNGVVQTTLVSTPASRAPLVILSCETHTSSKFLSSTRISSGHGNNHGSIFCNSARRTMQDLGGYCPTTRTKSIDCCAA